MERDIEQNQPVELIVLSVKEKADHCRILGSDHAITVRSSCLWRLNKFTEAGSLFERMLWLNPTYNQGARFLFDEVRAKKPWESDCLEASHE